MLCHGMPCRRIQPQRRRLLDYVKGINEERYQDIIKRLGLRR